MNILDVQDASAPPERSHDLIELTVLEEEMYKPGEAYGR